MPALTNFSIVLDLDQCLIHSFTEEDGQTKSTEMLKYTNVAQRQQFYKSTYNMSKETSTYWGVRRPYLDKFLTFAFHYFKTVIVWSAGDNSYVNNLVDELFRDHPRPDLILTRRHIVYTKGSTHDYHKPLAKIEELQPGLIDPKFTFFVDDKLDNFRDNAANGICIPQYYPSLKDSIKTDDYHLAQLINWFNRPEVIECDDVRTLDKKRIFSSSDKVTNDVLRSSTDSMLVKYKHLTRPQHTFMYAPISL